MVLTVSTLFAIPSFAEGFGGTVDQQLHELYLAVMSNPVAKEEYLRIQNEEDDWCTDEILPIVLEMFSIKMDIVGDKIVYWDGHGTHEEVLWMVSHHFRY